MIGVKVSLNSQLCFSLSACERCSVCVTTELRNRAPQPWQWGGRNECEKRHGDWTWSNLRLTSSINYLSYLSLCESVKISVKADCQATDVSTASLPQISRECLGLLSFYPDRCAFGGRGPPSIDGYDSASSFRCSRFPVVYTTHDANTYIICMHSWKVRDRFASRFHETKSSFH